MSEPTNRMSTSVSVDGDGLDGYTERLCHAELKQILESDELPEETKDIARSKFISSFLFKRCDLITAQINRLAALAHASSPEMLSPWYSIASPLKKQKKDPDLRSKAIMHYEGSLSDVVEGKGIPAVCVISGEKGFSNQVICAHLLPRKTPKYLLKSLGMNDVDSLRNVCMLSKNIEHAFDRMQLCIVPCKEPNSTGYNMIVWDSSILDEKIFDGSDKTIGEVENQAFHFPDGKTPYTRNLNYQAQASYSYALTKGWISEDETLRPEQFGSPLLSDILEIRSLAMDQTLVTTDGDSDSCFNLTVPLNGAHPRNLSSELSAEGDVGAGKDIPLLAADGDVHAVDNTGWTPLHGASRWGHGEMAKMLLDAGANVNAVDNRGNTPLHHASRYGHDEVAKMLLDAGANVNAVDNSGNTPLHSASWYGHDEVAKMLLDAGANVDAVDSNVEIDAPSEGMGSSVTSPGEPSASTLAELPRKESSTNEDVKSGAGAASSDTETSGDANDDLLKSDDWEDILSALEDVCLNGDADQKKAYTYIIREGKGYEGGRDHFLALVKRSLKLRLKEKEKGTDGDVVAAKFLVSRFVLLTHDSSN